MERKDGGGMSDPKKRQTLDLSDPRNTRKKRVNLVVNEIDPDQFLYVVAIPVNREKLKEMDSGPEVVADMIRRSAVKGLTMMQEAMREASAVS
jgi:hypothetical protein